MSTPTFPLPRPRGRPRKDPDVILQPVSVRLPAASAEKLRLLGGRHWLVKALARAKVPQ